MGDPLAPTTEGQTKLDPDDEDGLRPTYITTRAELNEAEQAAIVAALARRPVPSPDRLLDDAYLRRLHRDMFAPVWTWAGRYRMRETNIGVEPSEIALACRNLAADARIWVETEEADLAAARFHHRLVQIHAYRNGNGRHARAATDLLLRGLEIDPFSWGANMRIDRAAIRSRYLVALRHADSTGDVAHLLEFARS